MDLIFILVRSFFQYPDSHPPPQLPGPDGTTHPSTSMIPELTKPLISDPWSQKCDLGQAHDLSWCNELSDSLSSFLLEMLSWQGMTLELLAELP